jgi:uncharacterized Zn finger protein
VIGDWWLVGRLANNKPDISAKEAKVVKAEIKSYRDLETWQKAIELVEEVYEETRSFPKEEIYGLVSQMRRSGGFGRVKHRRRARARFHE